MGSGMIQSNTKRCGKLMCYYPKTQKLNISMCISREREGYWSEAIAVGDPDWLESAASEAGIKRYTVQNDKNAYIDFMTVKK